jgi:hypothetical protein
MAAGVFYSNHSVVPVVHFSNIGSSVGIAKSFLDLIAYLKR